MCSRYYIEMSPELRPVIEAARRSSLGEKMVHDLGRPVITEGEIKPTDIVPVIASSSRQEPSVFPMIWGFKMADRDNTRRSQPLINARSETAAVKLSFKECWQRRRCIVPASWYYEWEHFTRPDGSVKVGNKYTIQPAGATVTWIAGLYRMENGFPYFTILTRQPDGELRKLHDRMPLILPKEALSDWINPAAPQEKVTEIANSALTEMVWEKAD